MKYKIKYSNLFKKQYKKLIKQGRKIDKLNVVINNLANDKILDSIYRNHKLCNSKKFNNCYDCHIEPDWILIYKIEKKELILILVETGSHSEVLDI